MILVLVPKCPCYSAASKRNHLYIGEKFPVFLSSLQNADSWTTGNFVRTSLDLQQRILVMTDIRSIISQIRQFYVDYSYIPLPLTKSAFYDNVNKFAVRFNDGRMTFHGCTQYSDFRNFCLSYEEALSLTKGYHWMSLRYAITPLTTTFSLKYEIGPSHFRWYVYGILWVCLR